MLGLEGRSAFYEGTGAYRDMVVTHLMQVLAFMAMEPPTSLLPGPIGEGKLKGVKMGARLLILVDSCEALLGALPPAQIAPQKKAKRNQGVLAAANEAEA